MLFAVAELLVLIVEMLCSALHLSSDTVSLASVHVDVYKIISYAVKTLLTTHEAAWYIILVVCVCMYICQMITFESIDTESSYLHI